MSVRWDQVRFAQESVFGCIGRTPIVELRRIDREEGISTKTLVKLEYMNPTGSLKDRIYYEMITRAVARGDLKPRMEILEASTGNAGIACSFVAKMLGYQATIVLPSGMSQERMKLIRAYGAKIVNSDKRCHMRTGEPISRLRSQTQQNCSCPNRRTEDRVASTVCESGDHERVPRAQPVA